MANSASFKPAFDALATDGHIGDPNGQLAYAYLRVSTDDQADEGRSGLSRQLEHIHEVASERGYRIGWEFVYADDFTGFDFEGRPALTQLRQAYKSPHRRAHAVVIEHLDRLSRHADWHQGYLLDELRKHGLEVIFWKSFSSRIEQAVMGAITQEGMEQAIERMRVGTLKKAKSGRVTAKRSAFGYKLVDAAGNENTMEARRETYYSIDEERAVVVKFMYAAIAYGGMSCYELIKALDERGKVEPSFRPPKAKAWNERSIVKMLRNPVYKGEFIANRFYKERVLVTDENGITRYVQKERQRPEDEWVYVPVPPIVDETTWDLAQRNLYRNKGFAKRNKKYEYLLTSMIRCDTCGWRYHGHTDSKSNHIQRYYCSKIYQTPTFREHRPCDQKSIHCHILDTAVWEIIASALLEPSILLDALDARYSGDWVADIRDQVEFLKRHIEEKADEEQKLYKAYLAGAYNADEYASERKRVRNESEHLLTEIERLQSQIMTQEELEDRKQTVIDLVARAQQIVDIHDAPINLKQQIARLLVDEIVLNVNEGWFELHGTVGTGLLFLSDASVVRTSGRKR